MNPFFHRSSDKNGRQEFCVAHQHIRSCAYKCARWLAAGIAVLVLLGMVHLIRQECLNQELVRDIIAHRDKAAIIALERGANASTLYDSASDATGWRRLLAVMLGSPGHTPHGLPPLILIMENMPAVGNYFLPPTEDRLVLMRMLIEKGTPVNVRDRYGRTPLEFAVQYDSYELVECLLDHNAELNMPASAGLTILERAIQQPDHRIFLLIIDHGADINRPDSLGETPLHWAREVGQVDYENILVVKHAKDRGVH